MNQKIINLIGQDFTETIVSSDMAVLVDFWADWCGPCHVLAPVVEAIAAEHAGKLQVATLNVDENPRTAQENGALSIPILILFSEGKEQGRVVGARNKEAIVDALLRDVAAKPASQVSRHRDRSAEILGTAAGVRS